MKEKTNIEKNGKDPRANRVKRGGCWYNSAQLVRVPVRYYGDPTSTDDDLGFCLILQKNRN